MLDTIVTSAVVQIEFVAQRESEAFKMSTSDESDDGQEERQREGEVVDSAQSTDELEERNIASIMGSRTKQEVVRRHAYMPQRVCKLTYRSGWPEH